jgi:predicted ATPase/class 3 adenylate cyclase
VTFLFTDLEGSTSLWEHHPEAMRDALARHDAILRDAVAAHAGYLVKTTGDGVHAAFGTAADAVDAALSSQLALREENWTATGPFRVRMGLHTGAAELRDGDYYGGALNRAARLMAIAHGDQILVSLATGELLRDGDYELVDLGEHRLRDLGRAERVFQVTDPRLPREFPALRSLESFPTNLPLQMTSFVGRSRELDEVIKALEDNRVVTMTGVGGVGKTRLAVQVGGEVLPRYRDGVWFCELGPVGDAELVPDFVASALGVQQRPGASMRDSVVATCARRELLLVLDNCEHLLDAAAEMVEGIERGCPDVRVLCTSREGLGVSGERIMVLRSLQVPSEGSSVDGAAEIDAVRLFVERAAAARRAFTVTADNIDAITQICRRLDGIPLAIELAAARVRMMSPDEIASRLDERFRLLTGGNRTTVERHQTLRQAVDWSYDLLDDRERALLNRLGVFAAGFTLEAAETVAAGDGLDAFDVLDGLGQLVDKSLVVADDTISGTRYRLLETIRQYSLERLDQAGETDAVRRQHAQWMVVFVARAGRGWRGPDEHHWLERLDTELDNVRAALTWAVGNHDLELAVGLIASFDMFFLFSSSLGYALAPWGATVLALDGASTHPRRSTLLTLRAIDHLHHDRLPAAIDDAEAAVAAMDGRVPFVAAPWATLFMSHVFAVSSSDVADRYEECLRAARASGSDFELAAALIPASAALFGAHRITEARACAEEGMLVARRSGSPTQRGISANMVAVMEFENDPDRARQLLRDSLDATENPFVGNMRGTGLLRLGRLEHTIDDPEWARTFRPCLASVQHAGDRRAGTILLELYSRALAEAGRYEIAGILRWALPGGTMIVGNVSDAEQDATEDHISRALGADRAIELRALGEAMDIEEAVGVALAELDRVIAAG